MRNSFFHATMTFRHTFTPQRLIKCQFLKLLKWDFEKNKNRGRKVLEFSETWRSAKIFFCPQQKKTWKESTSPLSSSPTLCIRRIYFQFLHLITSTSTLHSSPFHNLALFSIFSLMFIVVLLLVQISSTRQQTFPRLNDKCKCVHSIKSWTITNIVQLASRTGTGIQHNHIQNGSII